MRQRLVRLAGLTGAAIWLLSTVVPAPAIARSLDKSAGGRGAIDQPPVRKVGLAGSPFFVENHGQADARVRFQARGARGGIDATEPAVWLTVFEPAAAPDPTAPAAAGDPAGHAFRLSYTGANPTPRIEGIRPLATRVNYLIGRNPADWRTDLPTWGGVRYVEIFRGIDLEITGDDNRYSQRFVIRDADADRAGLLAARLQIAGGGTLSLDDGTAVRVGTPLGDLQLGLAEIVDPWASATAPPPARILADPATGEVALPFRPNGRPRVGPAGNADLVWSTFLGGSIADQGADIEVDAQGFSYVTGNSKSPDFPTTPGAFQRTDRSVNHGENVVVAKFNQAGTNLVYATFVGGSQSDVGLGMALDGQGNVYVAGRTTSLDFPYFLGFDPLFSGNPDEGFVFSLNANGSGLNFSTFVGGSGSDFATDVAVDSAGSVYVTGSTTSVDFPATPGAWLPPGSFVEGTYDGFVLKLPNNGAQVTWGTYVGGSGGDYGTAITVDATSSVYVTGLSQSTNFPVTTGAFQRALSGEIDAFVVKINPGGTAPVYATYLGGLKVDQGFAIAVDSLGNAYVTGQTSSLNFPTTSGAFRTTNPGGAYDVFVVSINSIGSALNFGTYLGGSSGDSASAIGLDPAGNVYVAGGSYSTDYPTTPSAFQTSMAGIQDAFLAKFSSNGSSLIYSTYLGGIDADTAEGMAIDANGIAYLTGWTQSSDFPVTTGAYDTVFAVGYYDIFVSKLQPSAPTPTYTATPVGTPARFAYLPLVTRISRQGW